MKTYWRPVDMSPLQSEQMRRSTETSDAYWNNYHHVFRKHLAAQLYPTRMRQRLSAWWLDVREWIAAHVLRVKLHGYDE